jgi:hypothetical protein
MGGLSVAAAVPRGAVGTGETGGAVGFTARPDFSPTGGDERVWDVRLSERHGARRNRLRGKSPPNHPATHGPTRSASTTITPAPRHSRNQPALKMLGWRRMRCDTSDLTRLILEFPKYDRILDGQS